MIAPSPGPGAGSDRSLVDILADDRYVNLFVHDVTSAAPFEALTRTAPGLDHYDERALLLAGPRDVVCLRERPDESYLDYLVELGLGVRREQVLTPVDLGATPRPGPAAERLLASPGALRELSRHLGAGRRVRLHSFVAAEHEFELAAALERSSGSPVQVLGGRPRAIDLANQKHRVRAKARELGIPIAPGEIVELAPTAGAAADLAPLRAAVARQRARTGRALVRGTRGACGSATLVAPGDGGLDAALAALVGRGDNRIFLVDAFLAVTVSPNLQLYIDPDSGALEPIALTDQMLDGDIVHHGNVHPSRATHAGAMWEHALALARWLRDEGCTGVVGLDFCELATAADLPGGLFLAELNARTNGATYSVGLFERVVRRAEQAGREPPRAFVARSFATRLDRFDALRRAGGDLLLAPAGSRGMVPFNLATLPFGLLCVVALGPTPESAAAVSREAERRLR